MTNNPWAPLYQPGPKAWGRTGPAHHSTFLRAEGYGYLSMARDAGPQGVSIGEAARRADAGHKSVISALVRMNQRGLLQRVERGAYTITDKGQIMAAMYEKRKGISA